MDMYAEYARAQSTMGQHVFGGDAIETMNYGDFNASSPGRPSQASDKTQVRYKAETGGDRNTIGGRANCSRYTHPNTHKYTPAHTETDALRDSRLSGYGTQPIASFAFGAAFLPAGHFRL